METQIHTNPNALRNIALKFDIYTMEHCQIIRDYLSAMSSYQNDIEINRYRDILEEIEELLKRMDFLKETTQEFSAFLRNRADYLDNLSKG